MNEMYCIVIANDTRWSKTDLYTRYNFGFAWEIAYRIEPTTDSHSLGVL